MDHRTDHLAGALPAIRIVSGEITRTGEQPAAVVHLTGPQLSQLIDRAARPIVLQGPQPYPAPYAAPAAGGNTGINVTYSPAASSGHGYVLPGNVGPLAPAPEQRSWWPIVFMTAGCTGLASGLMAAVTGSQFAIIAVFASVAAWGVAGFKLVFER